MRIALRHTLPCQTMIVWMDYRKIRGVVTEIKCGPVAVIRRVGESIESLEGRAMSRGSRTL
jgi:hypothetical protein